MGRLRFSQDGSRSFEEFRPVRQEMSSMRVIPRAPVLLGAVAAWVCAAWAVGQTVAPPAGQVPAKGAPSQAQSAPRNPALSPESLNQVVATVNGDKITRRELVKFLSNYNLPPEGQEQIYHDAVESLINTKLINQFLARQRIQAPPDKVDEAMAQLEKDLKAGGSSLAQALNESNTSLNEVRDEYANRIRWFEYLNLKATDAELRKFLANNKDLFSGTQVKASHILVMVDPKASTTEKEQTKTKLLGIKKDVEGNKMSFAEAANKFSQDPANSEKAGGDLGYFTRNSGFIEEFADAAFAAKQGTITDPVETAYGYHLIQVTDRKEGKPVDFEQQKPFVKHMYAVDLMKKVLEAERKTAKIDIKPMPPDLFAPLTAPGLPPALPANPAGAATKGATPKNP
jgi:parvulin-like peptidyl-prolyl isomerase